MKFECPECAGRIAADPSFSGKSVSCPHCGGTLTVPGNSEEPQAALSEASGLRPRPANKGKWHYATLAVSACITATGLYVALAGMKSLPPSNNRPTAPTPSQSAVKSFWESSRDSTSEPKLAAELFGTWEGIDGSHDTIIFRDQCDFEAICRGVDLSGALLELPTKGAWWLVDEAGGFAFREGGVVKAGILSGGEIILLTPVSTSSRFKKVGSAINGTPIAPEELAALRARAESGDPEVQNVLGAMYLYGSGVMKDPPEGVKWLKLAVSGGNLQAHRTLGTCYDSGVGTERDGAAALKLYKKAAAANLPMSEYLVGRCYDDAIGCVRNPKEAIRWYRMAAEHGDSMGQLALANCLAMGDIIEKNESEAVFWWSKSAEQGCPAAQFSLAESYGSGKGVSRDPVLACKWMFLAAGGGYAPANAILDVFSANMTLEQLSEGDRLAVEWKQRAQPTAAAPSEQTMPAKGQEAPIATLPESKTGPGAMPAAEPIGGGVLTGDPGSRLKAITGAINQYQATHNGTLPKDWQSSRPELQIGGFYLHNANPFTPPPRYWFYNGDLSGPLLPELNGILSRDRLAADMILAAPGDEEVFVMLDANGNGEVRLLGVPIKARAVVWSCGKNQVNEGGGGDDHVRILR
ncbi:MAG: sel1 repeat family protein [Verrucomicrobia bacterium]|nr:sel1 repeat family protein [Verrucomicrobiota bacterium]